MLNFFVVIAERLDALQLENLNNCNKENPGVISLLHLVVSFADLPIDQIQLLLETGADPNAVDIHGNTPLHLLALNG